MSGLLLASLEASFLVVIFHAEFKLIFSTYIRNWVLLQYRLFSLNVVSFLQSYWHSVFEYFFLHTLYIQLQYFPVSKNTIYLPYTTYPHFKYRYTYYCLYNYLFKSKYKIYLYIYIYTHIYFFKILILNNELFCNFKHFSSHTISIVNI